MVKKEKKDEKKMKGEVVVVVDARLKGNGIEINRCRDRSLWYYFFSLHKTRQTR